MKLAGKTAMITGGGRDIGAAAARTLAAEGANVAISYFESSAGADTVVADIEKAGGKAIAVQADLNTQAGVDALVGATLDAFGGVDVLVNNAGGLVARKTFAEMDVAFWEQVMTLNVTSTFMMTKACLEHMKPGSAIVNIASQAARDGGGPGSVAYASSKGAVMTMTRGLAKEVGPDIRVNALCPGMIDTDFHNIHTPDAGRRGFEANAPLKRQGTIQDTANLILFLACADSAFMTGTNIDINGGMIFS
ncbi:SDR family NAD(P)-dependent oxidoreductase [Pseudooctadecabacter jejudonensis]|uniref:Glucose 1-dehydrogenase 2 n=1 Tax=Pseudooctadecabacter jejudonensis TaxID=1391910 RepID=A0A1Y5TFP1_9RHOB|nr:SDR family oxidoreductase [Pseudooctadecabacter jejudonensis]SLN63140.1 Glucose 1-dehydrogenase 2 [Pseudooctadecabacter jejudonensis]